MSHSPSSQPDVVLFGIQGSGKGTQAKHLIEQYDYSPFEMGAVLREIAQGDSELGETVRSYQESGQLVPKEIVEQVMQQRIEGVQLDQPILFDGVPRNPDQKVRLDELRANAGRERIMAVLFELDEETAEQRMIGRGRPDDLDAGVRRKRIDTFNKQTMPAVEAFEQEGNLRRIDASLPPKEVYAHLLDALALTRKQLIDAMA